MLRMRVIYAIFNFFMVLSYCPLKTVQWSFLYVYQNFNSNRSYKHLNVADARNFHHFEFFMVIFYRPLKTVQLSFL